MNHQESPTRQQDMDAAPVTFALDPPARMRWKQRVRLIVADDRSWLAAALVTTLLLGWNGEEASSVAWLNPVLFVVALAVRWHDRRSGRARLTLGRWATTSLFVVAGWAIGMVVELTIAAGGDGFGGMHPDTGPSFVIAQGYYIPAVLLTLWAVRRYGLDERRAFWFAGAMAWWEALTFGVVAMISPAFPLAPILAAYYVATYALCGMAGMLVVDHRVLHAAAPRSISTRRLVGYGVAAGTASWAAFMLWAVTASALFGFEL